MHFYVDIDSARAADQGVVVNYEENSSEMCGMRGMSTGFQVSRGPDFFFMTKTEHLSIKHAYWLSKSR